MSFVAAARRSSPVPLNSLPPSPDEDDLGWRGPWYHNDDEPDRQGVSTTERSQLGKGKAKATATEHQAHPSASYANGGTGGASQTSNETGSAGQYPPTTDEDTDSRRVEENLKRWEIAERQRWKAARQSTSYVSSSVLADVARRATSFWSRRASHPPAHGVGRHRALQTSEDDTHPDDTATSPPPSVPPSRSSTPVPGQLRTGPYARTTDPFSDPVGSASSLFVNAQPIAITTDIGASASFVALEDSGSTATLSPEHLTSQSVAAPAPLDLPKPRSPPPRTATPHANRPPEPFPRPDSRMSRAVAEDDEEEKPVQWWTDWLCGCSEGLDRGGEVQAGRTNPLE